jgi:hypothetical protein
MSDIVYAVHTRSCTYLLDDEGICRWVLSRSGAKSDDRCVGAQFVAALDLHSKDGLIGELRIGASALFIRSDGGRFMLIRTKPIEYVELRDAGAAEPEDPYQADEYPTEPEPEPVVLPSHHAVAGVFEAPMHAPEPLPPAEQRVIVQASQPYYETPQYELPQYEPPPPQPYYEPPPPRQAPAAPLPPVYGHAEPSPPMRGRTEPLPGRTEPPPPPAPPPMVLRPPLPIAPPRAARAHRNDEVHETQPLPPAGPPLPTGRVPAWPPMLAPPPPQAELLPIAPSRPGMASSEELDDADLEEVGEDEQVYSTEVTLSLPLFRSDPRSGHVWRR